MKAPRLTDTEVHNLKAEIAHVTKLMWIARKSAAAMRDNLDYIQLIKEAIAKDDTVYAQQLWEELPYPIQAALIVAPSKGGAFTTAERATIRGFWNLTLEDMES